MGCRYVAVAVAMALKKLPLLSWYIRKHRKGSTIQKKKKRRRIILKGSTLFVVLLGTKRKNKKKKKRKEHLRKKV